MQLSHEKNCEVTGWSSDEELVISTIQQTESWFRVLEAIRRMQRHQKAVAFGGRPGTLEACGRSCHWAVVPESAMYERRRTAVPIRLRISEQMRGTATPPAKEPSSAKSVNAGNRASDRHNPCGSKRGQSGSVVPPHQPREFRRIESPCDSQSLALKVPAVYLRRNDQALCPILCPPPIPADCYRESGERS